MNRRRKSVLPWLVSAMVVAVFIPTFAWGESQAGPAPSANAGFVAHDGSEAPVTFELAYKIVMSFLLPANLRVYYVELLELVSIRRKELLDAR